MPAQTVIQLRRDTAANWTTANSVLASGEPGVETDTNKVKLGDGITAWSSLTYFGSLDSLNNIGDVIISSATSGQVLQYDGTDWVNATIDVDISTKQDVITGAASTVTDSNLAAGRAMATDSSGKIAASTVTSVQLGHLSGVSSNIQLQLASRPNLAQLEASRIVSILW